MIDLSKYNRAAQILALRLTGQVGPRTFAGLMTHFKTIDNILLAEEHELLEIDGIGEKRSEGIGKAGELLDKAQQIIDNLDAYDAKVSDFMDNDFPDILQELNNPPPLIYYKGKLPTQDEKRVAIIGSQNVSAEGIGDAVGLAEKLAKAGISIVSGLARGIDTAGHVGALKADGKTYGILPCGIDIVHPSENDGIAKEITETGSIISEYIPGTPVSPGRLLSRNRLIAGLSQAVIIGEVSDESVGTLDAALCCHQLGKLLFVIIGEHNPHYEKLLEFGAIPLTNINEYEMILKALV
ncbi:MAG: DNA-protecting protein DprA [candidate division Zixibacteria bacterium]|nr:DNA-protecting protein DprA [candidate division Zixibacteria bacterium]